MGETPPVSPSRSPRSQEPGAGGGQVMMSLSTGCEDHWSWNKNDKSHEVRLYGPKQRIGNYRAPVLVF